MDSCKSVRVIEKERGVDDDERRAGERGAVGARARRRNHEPVERRAFALELLGGEVLDRERERNFARGDEAARRPRAASTPPTAARQPFSPTVFVELVAPGLETPADFA